MSKRKILNTWRSFYSNKGVSNELATSYLEYIEKLLNNNVPIIFDFNHLALLLGRQKFYLASVVHSPVSHYRSFKIKKRIGGFREISAPYPALREMQNWIYRNILTAVPLNSSAHGFTHKKSIITNAKVHAGQKELLKIDLKDFFPSININRIMFVFKELGYPNEIAFLLASICSLEEHLPQGAPTSPVLSNIIAKALDKRLISLAKAYNLHYTRYADDLTFSGENIPAKLIEYINSIVIDEGFTLNQSKTRLYKQRSKRIVTGISVIDKTIKVPREYKRKLKQELHYIFKFGFTSHVKKKKIRSSKYLISLIGRVNFWLSVEPNDEYALDAKRRLLHILKELTESYA